MFFFFIETCSEIQPDSQWKYFILYERSSEGKFSTLAYSSIYEEEKKVSEDSYLARISQFLVIPCYQRQGFAKMLLDGIYTHYIDQPNCLEISVEKPTKDFAAVRDRFEQQLIMS